jgi:3-dehydroquinate dehydratase-2
MVIGDGISKIRRAVSNKSPPPDRKKRLSSTLLVLNGPNLNLLGKREPDIYGHASLEDIRAATEKRAKSHGLSIDFRQTNDEGEMVSAIQNIGAAVGGVIINAAAYTHTSVAILDALLACDVPVVELHLSNIYRREEFRHRSFVSRAATGVICGFGAYGYELAIDAMTHLIGGTENP